jgi:hypothetical protein
MLGGRVMNFFIYLKGSNALLIIIHAAVVRWTRHYTTISKAHRIIPEFDNHSHHNYISCFYKPRHCITMFTKAFLCTMQVRIERDYMTHLIIQTQTLYHHVHKSLPLYHAGWNWQRLHDPLNHTYPDIVSPCSWKPSSAPCRLELTEITWPI